MIALLVRKQISQICVIPTGAQRSGGIFAPPSPHCCFLVRGSLRAALPWSRRHGSEGCCLGRQKTETVEQRQGVSLFKKSKSNTFFRHYSHFLFLLPLIIIKAYLICVIITILTTLLICSIFIAKTNTDIMLFGLQ